MLQLCLKQLFSTAVMFIVVYEGVIKVYLRLVLTSP